jgi:HD-GYP domain-containing protein (c-di-GMP phosphodiesterase class II)
VHDPREAIREVARVSEESTAALLADPDSAIVLIAEKAHDDGHAAHSLSVMTLALLLGKQAGLPEAALHALGIGALLHDIGKQAINPSILRNSERNRHEEAIYQTHCRGGFDEARARRQACRRRCSTPSCTITSASTAAAFPTA